MCSLISVLQQERLLTKLTCRQMGIIEIIACANATAEIVSAKGIRAAVEHLHIGAQKDRALKFARNDLVHAISHFALLQKESVCQRRVSHSIIFHIVIIKTLNSS
jgi:hypothetical protein